MLKSLCSLTLHYEIFNKVLSLAFLTTWNKAYIKNTRSRCDKWGAVSGSWIAVCSSDNLRNTYTILFFICLWSMHLIHATIKVVYLIDLHKSCRNISRWTVLHQLKFRVHNDRSDIDIIFTFFQYVQNHYHYKMCINIKELIILMLQIS